MEFPKKSCPVGRKRVTLGRFRNAILKEKLQMNMKNIIKNKQKELMQGMIALILCVALFCSAAVSGENDGSEWKMRHGGQKYEETGTDGRGSGRTSMSEAITSAISDAVCAVWQISTARLRSIPVLRGICMNMRGRCPAMHHRGRSGQSAGRI